jgi:hypothetical protein
LANASRLVQEVCLFQEFSWSACRTVTSQQSQSCVDRSSFQLELEDANPVIEDAPRKHICICREQEQEVEIGKKEEEQHLGEKEKAPEVLKGGDKKADDAPVNTHMWEHFCEKAVLEGRGPDGLQRPQRKEMPAKWKTALDGFRRFSIRWWRRSLVKSLLA